MPPPPSSPSADVTMGAARPGDHADPLGSDGDLQATASENPSDEEDR